MTDEKNEEPSSGDSNKGLKSGVFFVILAAVVGLFYYLSTLSAPPNLPVTEHHQIRLNNNGELIGVGALTGDAMLATLGDEKPSVAGKKDMEKAVNRTCIACHGRMDVDLTTHPCHQASGRCLPPHHPPKVTCIKCHRAAKKP